MFWWSPLSSVTNRDFVHAFVILGISLKGAAKARKYNLPYFIVVNIALYLLIWHVLIVFDTVLLVANNLTKGLL